MVRQLSKNSFAMLSLLEPLLYPTHIVFHVVWHGVAPVEEGIRYSLSFFFGMYLEQRVCCGTWAGAIVLVVIVLAVVMVVVDRG